MCRYNFAVRQQEVEQLKAVTCQQIRDFYTAHIPSAAQGRRRLAVHVVSNSHQEETSQDCVDDLLVLKESLIPCDVPQCADVRLHA